MTFFFSPHYSDRIYKIRRLVSIKICSKSTLTKDPGCSMLRSMDLDFYKIQTSGNDLILANLSDGEVPADRQLAGLAEKICRRDYGIGANGFIAVTGFSADGITARFIDPSGSFISPSPDAALCLSRYAFDSGIPGKNDFPLTINGETCQVGVIDSRNFRLSLGRPETPDGLLLTEDPDKDYIVPIAAAGREYPSTSLRLGKDGTVIFSEYRTIGQLKDISDEILKSGELPPASRLIFATVNSREELVVHIRNSRGDDFASSCAIAAAAAVVNGFLDHNASIHHKKGEYYFQWLQPSNEIFLTASADYVFTGSIFIDEI